MAGVNKRVRREGFVGAWLDNAILVLSKPKSLHCSNPKCDLFFKILIFFCTRVPGSIELSPPSETPSTPSYVRWRESITYLLDDDEGKELYSAYLAQQKLGHLLSFW